MTRTKALGRRCSWRHCDQPAAATVAFKLPNLLAGSRRDYCAEHARQVCLAKGTVVAARLGPRGQSRPSGRGDAGLGGQAELAVRTRRKGVMP
jgi:hypothetical protein